MSKLLISDMFDKFLLSEAVISTYNTFTIDGHINKDFYTSEELEESDFQSLRYISCWETLKPICFDLIKGKKTPVSFKFVFLLAPSNIKKILEKENIALSVDDINALALNIKYDNGIVTCTSGTSIRVFSLDKSLENAWDDMIKKFFISGDISFDEQ